MAVREPYIPLFTSVVRSSLWSLEGEVIKVFLTVCAEADPEGFCSASIDGIRRIADIPIDRVQSHIALLCAPDPHSKDLSRGGDGRRLLTVPGGWKVVNLSWYRELARKEAEKARKRRHWNEKAGPDRSARRAARRTETETETETEIRSAAPQPPAVTTEVIRRTYSCPADLQPLERHTARCSEFRLDAGAILEELKRWEPEKPVGDWHKALDRFISQAIKNRSTGQPRGSTGHSRGPALMRQPNHGKTGFEILGDKAPKI